MFIVTVVFIAVVSGIHLATQETVAENETLFLKRAVLYSADIDVPDSNADVQTLYNERVRERSVVDGDVSYFEITGPGGSGIQAFAVPYTSPGLWGDIDAVVGFTPDLETFTGIEFTYQNETPGLGGRITEEWFLEQFRGKRGPVQFDLDGEEGTATGSTTIDAVTGASYSSAAVRTLVNELYAEVASIIQGGN
jgi:Na+-transporting NADH:ubiquinone oxidoreductase subunit C